MGAMGNGRRQQQGFSLVELVMVVTVAGILAALSVQAIVTPRKAAEQFKLESDIRILNAAISVYLAFGGSLDEATTAQEVVDKLKTKADALSSQQDAGLTGSFVDQRLMVVTQTAEESLTSQPRAFWDAALSRFKVAYGGQPGVKRFAFDDGLAAGPDILEERHQTMNLAIVDDWIWDYAENPTSSPAVPTLIETSADLGGTVVVPPSPPVVSGELTPPVFSVITGSFPITDYDLALYLTDPNPPGKGQVVYSVASSVWTVYTGVPVAVPPGVEVRAFVEAIDPAWSNSTETVHEYAATPAKLAIPLISSSGAEFDFGANQMLLLTISDPNDSAISSIEYRKNGGSWQAYSAPVILNVLDDSFGVEIEARAVAASPYWLNSESASHLIDGATGVKLDVPVISFDKRSFAEGESIDVRMTNPNPSGSSEIHYQIVPVNVYFSTSFTAYSGKFKVEKSDYPDGFAIKAYAKSIAAPYTNSDFSLKSTGSFFGDDVNTGGLTGRFYDLKQFADGTPTNIEADTVDWFNQTYYNYLKQITPEIVPGSTWGFDPAVLKQFYSPSKAVFASRFSTPDLPADDAPTAFGVTAASTNWIGHYSGSIEPANSGWYRFSGRADDVLEVWIDGKLVLSALAYAWEVTPSFPWTEGVNWIAYAASHPIGPYLDASADMRETPVAGPWVYLDGPHEIDIVVGEQPGGNFNMNLRVEEQGVSYADGPQIFTTRTLTGDDALEVSGAYWMSAPGTSDPPVFYVVE